MIPCIPSAVLVIRSLRVCRLLLFAASVATFVDPAGASPSSPLGPEHLLILVNAQSPVSRSVADLYRRYHPEITPEQVLQLGPVPAYPAGLPDCADPSATPASEIITRDQFEQLIAGPVRTHLVSSGRVNSVYCIVTTCGMPYRISDSNRAYAGVVTPAGSNPSLVMQYRTQINAASVESELTVLFGIDPQVTPGAAGPGVPIQNRVVNPYLGYASGLRSWEISRDILNHRMLMRWDFSNLWPVGQQPRIEGARDTCNCSSVGRRMSPADIYLVARLDGPHTSGAYPIFAVKDMLDRAAMVSDPGFARFVGFSSSRSAIVTDCSPPAGELATTAAHNFPAGAAPLRYEVYPTPPGKEAYAGCGSTCPRGGGNHYKALYTTLTGLLPVAGSASSAPASFGMGGVCVWDDTSAIMRSDSVVFPADAGLFGLLTYGCNGKDGRPPTYLVTGGPAGQRLFPCVPGAVFASVESFNALTMFTDTGTCQAKIAEFIAMGGSAAIGHAFEPELSAIPQAEFLVANLLRDENGDGVGDLCLAEAAWSSIPYVSWSEVPVGDPLMRIRVGPGGLVSDVRNPGDTDADGLVGFWDLMLVVNNYDVAVGETIYDPAADLDRDGYVGFWDLMEVVNLYGTDYTIAAR